MRSFVVCVLISIFVMSATCAPGAQESSRISPEIICRQAFVIGDCFTTWSYDPSKGKCRESCGNNENKFTSKQQCELTCKGIYEDGNETNDSEEIKIKAFERVNDPHAKEPDLLI